MRKIFLLILLFTLTAVTLEAGVPDYFRDRGNDFLDIFLLRVSAARGARGIGLHARATCLAQIGMVYFEGEHFGLDRRGIGVWKEKRTQGGVSLFSFSSVQNEIVWGNYFLQEDTPWINFEERGLVRNDVYWDDGRKHIFSLKAEVQPGILPGLELGLYPFESLDFLVGLFTLDPQNDDLERVFQYAPEYSIFPEEFEETEELPIDIEELLEESEPPVPEETDEHLTEPPKQPHSTEGIPEIEENDTKSPTKPYLPPQDEYRGIPETQGKESPPPNAQPAKLVTRKPDSAKPDKE